MNYIIKVVDFNYSPYLIITIESLIEYLSSSYQQFLLYNCINNILVFNNDSSQKRNDEIDEMLLKDC